MATTLDEMLARLDPEERAQVEAETERLHQEYRSLQQLRQARTLTQARLAGTLGVRQATVAQMEKRSDLLLSTPRGYVEAMGGRLSLVAEFPDRPPVRLGGLGEVDR